MNPENSWLMRIERGLAAHFNQPDGPSRPGVMWSVGLKRGAETWTVQVKALLSDEASATTRADQEYQARTTMQYLNDRLAQGWHPSEPQDHTIFIGDPSGGAAGAAPAAPGAEKPWWKIW